MRKQGINQCAAFAAGARMNRNSRRFVYHNQIVVFEQNGERDLFRDQIDRLNRWLDQDNAIACSDNVARTRHAPFTVTNPSRISAWIRERENSFAELARKRSSRAPASVALTINSRRFSCVIDDVTIAKMSDPNTISCPKCDAPIDIVDAEPLSRVPCPVWRDGFGSRVHLIISSCAKPLAPAEWERFTKRAIPNWIAMSH